MIRRSSSAVSRKVANRLHDTQVLGRSFAEPVRLGNRLERTSPRTRRSVSRSWCGRIGVVTRVVHVPYVVEQDEDGVWCASAQLRPGVGAVGDGPTAEAAVADLRGALEALLAEVGPPDELTLTLDVA